MEKSFTIELPAMYGDHHVVEVRKLLLSLDGVIDVYASSAFGAAEITYDPQNISIESIKQTLQAAGYTEELTVPVEKRTQEPNGTGEFFRKTAVYQQTRTSVTFGQNVANLARPLWNCPGMGVIQKMED